MRRNFAIGCLATFVFICAVLICLFVLGALVSRTEFGECIALVRIEGPIYESREIVDAIRRARKSDRARALVVRVDSPGGAVGASEEIYRELLRTRSEKPVVVSMGNVAASGGYYVAVAGDEIIANAGTITGSIGVIATDVELDELLRSLKIRPNIIKSGEHKDTGSPLRPMSDEERRLLQKIVFDLHRQFVREVVRQRHKAIEKAESLRPNVFNEIIATSETKSREGSIELSAFNSDEMARELSVPVETVNYVKGLADGRVFTGEQALALGLVDRLGNVEDARLRAASMASLPVGTSLRDYTPQKGIANLVERLAGQAHSILMMSLNRPIEFGAH
ncbi:MAG: signal peptide peptidase SppA [Candidatus Sumerlaeaceae bacterium]|nr:signal peptide peptidase SppA [Candidatus Sumerlaeaceae bacterium]